MPEPEPALSIAESSGGYQLRVVQEVLLALLAKEQADLRWLEACAQYWYSARGE